jgi:peptide deformylase
MAKLPIIYYPDAVLRKSAEPFERVDNETRRLAEDMIETMMGVSGLGLAAPQIGLSRRLFVMNAYHGDEEEGVDLRGLINPEILEKTEEMRVYEEGCLSIPGISAEVERPSSVLIRYIDLDGEIREEWLHGRPATIAQHELDHLNGVLFIDHLSRLKRDFLIRKYRKARQSDETV